MAKKSTNKLIDKYKKTGEIKSEVFTHSKYALDGANTPLDVPLMNFALSGDFKKGFSRGITVFAAKSKHFKTLYILTLVKEFLNQNPDGICWFYDNEFGAKQAYFRKIGVDVDRVLHIPFKTVEELSQDMVQKLDAVEDGEKIVIAIDSLGNAASAKEVEDALEGVTKVDMTRAKKLKSLGRMITPHFTINDIPCLAANHTYQTQEMYSKEVMSGGTGIEYSSDTIMFISKSQTKELDEDGDKEGYYFTLVPAKSRFIKENSRFPIYVRYKSGIEKWSGIFEFAQEAGVIVNAQEEDKKTGEIKTKKIRYALKGQELTMSLSKKDIQFNEEILSQVIEDEEFIGYMTRRFKLDA